MLVKLNCIRCNAEYFRFPYQANKSSFCSQKCQTFAVKHICKTCNKQFSKPPSAKVKTEYCSRKCRMESRKNILCESCKKEFPVPKYLEKVAIYCSQKCRQKGDYKNCVTCGARYFAPIKNFDNSKYCSNQCRFPEYYEAKPFLDTYSDLKWCSFGLHIYLARDTPPDRKCCPECSRIKTNIRRSTIENNGGKFTSYQWQQKIEYYSNRCYLCKESLVNKIVHIEHRIPISRGGTNWIANIAPACSKCNLKKGNKTEKEFLEIV